jgi:hypothetical protein
MTSRAYRAAPPTYQTFRTAVTASIASVVLLVGLIVPARAAGSVGDHDAAWSPGSIRDVTQHHVNSARAAAREAVDHPRRPSTRNVAPRPVAIAHPAHATPAGSNTTASGVRRQIIAPPDLTVATEFDGLAQSESGDYYPPDPWVAVNSAYVVQAVNVVFRISNRAGAELSSIPAWALFALPAGQFSSDQRIIWDATHGRWVAIAISFNETEDDNFLNLAISDGADPTAGWSTWSISYGAFFPDFPSVASSNDKVVLTDNLFDDTAAFYAADIQTLTWASILGGGSLGINECFGNFAHPRAAQVLSATTDVHLIMEDVFDGSQVYYRITGSGRCDDTVNQFVDRTDLTGFPAFTQPPEPRQSPGDTIADFAVDERPTDAIWQNNRLSWVSTFPVSYDGGATVNDAVIIWTATTAPGSGPATEAPASQISAGDGIDDFMGGIGLTRNGTLVTIYSQSSPSQFVSMEANQIPVGSVLATPIHLDDSDATYPNERWGDFAGVAMDPVGTGSVWATHQVAAADGTWRTDVFRLVVDNDDPGLPGLITAAPVIPTTLRVSVPMQLSWSAATDGMTNVARYEIAQQIDGGGFAESSTLAGPSTTRSLLIGHTYQFEVRAIDVVGHVGGWRVGPTFRAYLTQSTSSTTTSGTWHTSSSASYSGGSTRYASTSGARITFTATSARSIAIVTAKGSSRGSFKVYVDDVYRATISTYSTTTKYRQLVYQFRWSSPGTHKIKIVVSGTAHHPRVDVDAFVVLR